VTDIEALFPYDGPHTPDRVRAAARAVEDLVYYLGNATRRGAALPQPDDLAHVVASLHMAVSYLPQVLGQLVSHADRMGTWAGLYDDRGGDPGTVVRDLKLHLRTAAEAMPGELLGAAHEAASRLGANEGDAT
jgi:hypothetical protein